MNLYIECYSLLGKDTHIINHHKLTENEVDNTLVHIFTEEQWNRVLMTAFSNAKNVATFTQFKERMERESNDL
jgi:phosphoribosyl-AMP cyclohydrolase